MQPENSHNTGEGATGKEDFISVVVPAYNEARNLPILYQRVLDVMEKLDAPWEMIIIDDHSTDDTFPVIKDISAKDSRVRGARLAKNSGSDMAIMCGLRYSKGNAVIFLAADLQDPPEFIPDLVTKWRAGAQIVGAARAGREGVSTAYKLFSGVFYFMLRNVIGLKEIPEGGADFFLMDRCVVQAVTRFREHNICISFIIPWLGFRQAYIEYVKEPRMHGKTSWTAGLILKRIIDSVSFFSFMPIRVISFIGMIVAIIGFCYAIVVISLALGGVSVSGWASLMVVVLVIGGVQMLMMGTLGEYLWRALESARDRPQYLLEEETGGAAKVNHD